MITEMFAKHVLFTWSLLFPFRQVEAPRGEDALSFVSCWILELAEPPF